MKYFKKCLVLLLFINIFSCNNNTQRQIVGKDSTTLTIVDSDDREMEVAIALAKSSLDRFDSALFSNDSNFHSFALKVRFPYGENNGEHIWLSGISKNNGVYTGIVNNVPEYVSNIKLNDTIQINKKDISDWMYLKKNILQGGFTMKLIRKRMSPQERLELDTTSFFKYE
jgi:uncharacterized protein YegJ (DUF2314 family)